MTDRSKGVSEKNIIPKEKDGKEKKLNMPEHWKETITRKVDPIIRAINYDTEIGSTTAFAYRQGTFIDERELNLEKNLENAFHYGNEEYLNYLSENMDHMTDETFSEKDAVKIQQITLDQKRSY